MHKSWIGVTVLLCFFFDWAENPTSLCTLHSQGKEKGWSLKSRHQGDETKDGEMSGNIQIGHAP
jgi:hypothetical protein